MTCNNQEPYGFSVNKSDFPLNSETWEAMIKRIKDTQSDGETMVEQMLYNEESKKEKDQKEEACVMYPPVPVEPTFTQNMSNLQKIYAVQKYLNQLQYNHTGMQFFEIKKNRSITRLYDAAKTMIKISLPIKCLEAVVLSLYLTASIKSISRFTIRFKSKFGNITHKHIILGIYCNSNYGAIGLSRRKTLMDKPLTFKSLTELILEFRTCYKDCFHELQKVKLSSTISSDIHSCDHISWNHFVLPIVKLPDNEIKSALEKYSREMRRKTDML